MTPLQELPSTLALLLQETGAAPANPGGPGGPAPPSLFTNLLPILAIVAIFWFVMIGPERKKQKQRTAMLAAMKKGDKVMTSSGMYGTIAQIQDDVITLQVADGVRLRFNRAAIQTVLTDDKDEASTASASAKSA